MKRVFFILAMVLFPIMAFASPFIVSDPYPTNDIQPTVFEMIMDGGTSQDVLPVSSGGLIFQFDVAGMKGSHNVQVRACIPDDAGGRACSDYTPFAFTLISPPRAPTLRLQK